MIRPKQMKTWCKRLMNNYEVNVKKINPCSVSFEPWQRTELQCKRILWMCEDILWQPKFLGTARVWDWSTKHVANRESVVKSNKHKRQAQTPDGSKKQGRQTGYLPTWPFPHRTAPCSMQGDRCIYGTNSHDTLWPHVSGTTPKCHTDGTFRVSVMPTPKYNL